MIARQRSQMVVKEKPGFGTGIGGRGEGTASVEKASGALDPTPCTKKEKLNRCQNRSLFPPRRKEEGYQTNFQLRLLLIEDSEEDALPLMREINRGGFDIRHKRVSTPEAMADALASEPWDLIISDYALTRFSGLAALKLFQQKGLDLPFIIVSGKGGEDIAVRSIKAGASDYILKSKLTRLVPAIDKGLRQAAERRERKQAEEAIMTEIKQSEEKLRQSYSEGWAHFDQTVKALASITEMRDPYTAGHQVRVSKLACAIAAGMGLSDEDRIKTIGMAASIHDIGKTTIPAEILNKPGVLNDIEMSLVHNHAYSGYEILKNINFGDPIAEIIWQHHERLNGSGYPRGLSGDEILFEARILAVSDVVETMFLAPALSPCPYVGTGAGRDPAAKRNSVLPPSMPA